MLTATWAVRFSDKRDGSVFFEQPAFLDAMKRYAGFNRAPVPLQPAANGSLALPSFRRYRAVKF